MLRRLSSPRLSDVYQPARAQFGGRGSFGNGGAMRAAPFALAFSDPVDIKRVRQCLLSKFPFLLIYVCLLGLLLLYLNCTVYSESGTCLIRDPGNEFDAPCCFFDFCKDAYIL